MLMRRLWRFREDKSLQKVSEVTTAEPGSKLSSAPSQWPCLSARMHTWAHTHEDIRSCATPSVFSHPLVSSLFRSQELALDNEIQLPGTAQHLHSPQPQLLRPRPIHSKPGHTQSP